MFPIPAISTLTKFSWLAEKYRITPNGFIEKISVSECEPAENLQQSPASCQKVKNEESSEIQEWSWSLVRFETEQIFYGINYPC